VATFFYYLRWPAELAVSLFDPLPAWLGLTLFSALSGIGMLWVVGKTTPQKRLERARDQIGAAIYELRIFIDSPRRVFSAQGRLIGWSLGYTALLLPSFLVLGPPLVLFYLQLELRHGIAPLEPNNPHVLQVDLAPETASRAIAPIAGPGVQVTAPAVHAKDTDRLYLRVEIDGAEAERTLQLKVGDQVVSKLLSSGTSRASPERVSGAAMLWAMGWEPPLPADGAVRAVRVPHPERPQRWLGIGMPWWVYWLIVATITALAFRRRLGVVL
jgi:hypothetical protein